MPARSTVPRSTAPRFLTTEEACDLFRWPTPKACRAWLSRQPVDVRRSLVLRRGHLLLIDSQSLERYLRDGSVAA